jgi:hypothetical protein
MFGHAPLSPRNRLAWMADRWDRFEVPAPPTVPAVEYTIGLDLGLLREFTALCVLERTAPPNEEVTYAVRYLRRWPIGTSYTTIAAEVAERAYRPDLKRPCIAADITGVGTAVMDMVEEALRAKAPDGNECDLQRVLITAGHLVNQASYPTKHVPKKELVSCLQAKFSAHRLKIVTALPDAGILVEELLKYKPTNRLAGNESFDDWRTRPHDDLVFAVALALWMADNAPRGVVGIIT